MLTSSIIAGSTSLAAARGPASTGCAPRSRSRPPGRDRLGLCCGSASTRSGRRRSGATPTATTSGPARLPERPRSLERRLGRRPVLRWSPGQVARLCIELADPAVYAQARAAIENEIGICPRSAPRRVMPWSRRRSASGGERPGGVSSSRGWAVSRAARSRRRSTAGDDRGAAGAARRPGREHHLQGTVGRGRTTLGRARR
jgi:hypothetical protein